MKRVWGLLCACTLLFGCRSADSPPSEPFQFPIAVFVQGKPNDYWDAVLRGLESRLDLPGVQLEKVFFAPAESATVVQRMREGDWRAVAFCASSDAWAKRCVDQTLQAGVPVVLVGADLPDTARLGYVGTYYYDAGRKAGAWYARRVAYGEVVVIAAHPVPRAVSEFWDGFRHGLLFNQRVQARLVPLSDSQNTPSVIQKVQSERGVRGIFLMGAEVAQQGVGVARRMNLGVLSWRESANDWYLSEQIDMLILERPEEIGVRTANLLRNLSQGRGADLQIVYVPYEWRAR
ncbi:MAG: substrate-binding domain-containing protein [Fimbriimonadales bacterium]|nr:substrate-binding domain-containing protein [Fimbriimonadales bacterium]